ncbi:MAG: Uma2 family endonuclease [Treponema sp.]|jgi:Uma2 family endonuclease|nr:Uma2 family endonuclease [Treponema sp.]
MSIALKQEQAYPNPLTEKRQFTYADYLRWSPDIRAEIIYGVAYMMSAPSTSHQRISMRLSQIFANFLEGRTCQVFAAPFSVRLFPKGDNSDDTVVEPDIVVICEPAKIDEHGCNGAPDLVIEILSPSTRRKDRTLKRELYQRAKVREYWIVSPDHNEIEVHLFESGKLKIYGVNEPDTPEDSIIPEIAPVAVLPGLEIDVKTIF